MCTTNFPQFRKIIINNRRCNDRMRWCWARTVAVEKKLCSLPYISSGCVYRLRRLFIDLMSMCHRQSLIFKASFDRLEQLPIKIDRLIFATASVYPIVEKWAKQNEHKKIIERILKMCRNFTRCIVPMHFERVLRCSHRRKMCVYIHS